MATPLSYHLIDTSIYFAVEADHKERAAAYRTPYDDGTEGETIHMLYWNNKEKEVHSCLIEEWNVISQLPEVGDG